MLSVAATAEEPVGLTPGVVARPIFFDERQHDALTELVNLAVNGAAARLRTMVGSEVALTVPAVALVTPTQAGDAVVELGLGELIAIRQRFDGSLAGETLLVFPTESSRKVLSLVLDGLPEVEADGLAEDALQEVGNVLLTGFLSTISNMLRRDFTVEVPRLTRSSPRELFGDEAQELVLLIYVNFTLRGAATGGYFAMILGVPSLSALRGILDAFIVQVGGQ